MFTKTRIVFTISLVLAALSLVSCSAHYVHREATLQNARGVWEHAGVPPYMRLHISDSGNGSLVTIMDKDNIFVLYIESFIPGENYFEIVLKDSDTNNKTKIKGRVMTDSILLDDNNKPDEPLILIREDILSKYREKASILSENGVKK